MNEDTESMAEAREIVLRRSIAAPRERVFEAWTDPAQLPRWFGPRGFSTTTHAIDIRVGGEWRYTMHGPDGTDYPNRIVYRELVRPERIVYEHDGDIPDDPTRFHVTVTLVEVEGRTELTSRMRFPTREQRDEVIGFGAVELGQQTMDKLAEWVEGRGAAGG